MQLLSLFSRKPEPIPVTLPPVRREIYGLNIDAAIISHENWVTRLEAICADRFKEDMNPDHLCHDHKCAIGKWIYGENSKPLIQTATVKDLKKVHKRFHSDAAAVIRLCQEGNLRQATQIMESHIHPLSRRVRYQLEALRDIELDLQD